jgi:mannose-1-phosphate guanylyltransferase
VEPSTVSSDFGWITPDAGGLRGVSDFRKVAAFVEKPPMPEALTLYSSGAVWNTMVVVARAARLLERFYQHLPLHADVLMTAHAIEAPRREVFLREWYPELPTRDFCRDLLTPSPGLCLFTWPAAMGWSDLGTPDRMRDWLTLPRRPLRMLLADRVA